MAEPTYPVYMVLIHTSPALMLLLKAIYLEHIIIHLATLAHQFSASKAKGGLIVYNYLKSFTSKMAWKLNANAKSWSYHQRWPKKFEQIFRTVKGWKMEILWTNEYDHIMLHEGGPPSCWKDYPGEVPQDLGWIVACLQATRMGPSVTTNSLKKMRNWSIGT